MTSLMNKLNMSKQCNDMKFLLAVQKKQFTLKHITVCDGHYLLCLFIQKMKQENKPENLMRITHSQKAVISQCAEHRADKTTKGKTEPDG